MTPFFSHFASAEDSCRCRHPLPSPTSAALALVHVVLSTAAFPMSFGEGSDLQLSSSVGYFQCGVFSSPRWAEDVSAHLMKHSDINATTVVIPLPCLGIWV